MNICKAVTLVFAISGLLCIGMAAHAARYAITNLGTLPGYGESRATCLNDKGQVAGYLSSNEKQSLPRIDGNSAFIWTHGRMALLPDSSESEAFDTVASGINNCGQVVGTLLSGNDGAILSDYQRAIFWNKGHLKLIPMLPRGNKSTAIAVNDAGRAACTVYDDPSNLDIKPNPPHLAIYSKGKIIDCGPGIATGINNADQVCGYVLQDSNGATWSHTSNYVDVEESGLQVQAIMCRVNKPQSSIGRGYALGLDGAGDVVGLAENAGRLEGFPLLRTEIADGIMKYARGGHNIYKGQHTPGHIRPSAKPILWRTSQGRSRAVPLPFHWLPQAINDKGRMVGGHWLWRSGHSDDLNALLPAHSGWTELQATAINNRSQIAGYGKSHGQTRAFLMTPH